MPFKTDRYRAGEFIITEAHSGRSRERVTVVVPAGKILLCGQVVGRRSSDGKYLGADTIQSDGTETVKGINYQEISNLSGTVDLEIDGVIVNADAEVEGSRVIGAVPGTPTWVAGHFGDIATLVANLLALGIKVRDPGGISND